MNSRERVLAAVNHRQPDRVPVGLLFAPEAYEKLREAKGLSDRALADWIGDDFAYAGPSYTQTVSPIHYADPTIEVTPEGHYLDIWRVPFRIAETECQSYVDLAGHPPLRACTCIEELADFPWPSPDAWDYSKVHATLLANRGKATQGHCRGFFEISHFMRGMVEFLSDLALDPDFACALMDHVVDFLYERARRILEAGRGEFTIFEYNDDVAAQQALFISPAMWRTFIKPRVARFCDLIHRHGAKVRYHCCGTARAILPDLIEIGVDILTPVQPLAAGMDPFELKALFGRDITFHGGVDTQQLLPTATPEDVAWHTRRMIDVVGRDGGFILAGSHSIQADVPTENVIAMIEAAQKGAKE
jgi:uroporphyrinogen decarboxylase